VAAVGINGSYCATVTLAGSGIGPGGGPVLQDTQQTTPGGINVPPTDAVTLTAGATTVILFPPATFQFTRITLLPPAGSVIAKTACGVSAAMVQDVTGLPGWTTGSMSFPAVPGGMMGIYATGSETLAIAYSL
jgi:hypothetical protein